MREVSPKYPKNILEFHGIFPSNLLITKYFKLRPILSKNLKDNTRLIDTIFEWSLRGVLILSPHVTDSQTQPWPT